MGLWIGLFKFSPVFVLAGLMISGMDCLIVAPIATIYASIVASITDKLKFNDLIDCAVDNVKNLNLVFFILMFAYAMAEAFMSTGVGWSIVNIALNRGLTTRTVAVVGFCLRNATLSDALGAFGSQLIPWHVYIGFYLGILSAVYPLHQFVAMDIIKYNIMAFVAVGSILILTLTGLDRFIPKFTLPNEPNVELKKIKSKKESNETA